MAEKSWVAAPDTTVEVGWRRLSVHAETLPPAEGAQILLDYRQKHPLAARELSRLMGLDINGTSAQELEKIIQDSLPVVALRPAG